MMDETTADTAGPAAGARRAPLDDHAAQQGPDGCGGPLDGIEAA